MDLKFDWWLSLALAIPVGIAANLLTPIFQTAIERRSEQGRQREAKREEKERKRAQAFANDLPAFYIHLLGVGIRISLLGALESVANSIFSMFPTALAFALGDPPVPHGSPLLYIRPLFSLCDSIFRLMITLLIFTLCKDAILLIRGVRTERKKANQALEPTAPSGRGSS